MEDAFFSAAEARVARPAPSLIPRCDQCKLYRTCKSPKMKPDGRGERRILVVAEYPGQDEDDQGKPLVGGMGRFLASAFRDLNVDMRRDCVLTNARICYDMLKAEPKTAVADCRPNLLRTIAAAKPNVIILAGGDAIRSLVGHLWRDDEASPVGRWVGWRIPAHKPNAWVCPTYNPAFVMRDEGKGIQPAQFRRHLADAVALADSPPWPDGPPDYQKRVTVEHDAAAAARWLDGITSGVVAYDYETNCLKPDSDQSEIACCSVCWDGETTLAFPWHGPVIPAMRRLLGDPAVGKLGSNIKFESRWSLAKLGVRVVGWRWDTMLAAHALDPRGHISGLKFQAFVRLGVSDYSQHLSPFLESREKGGYSLNRVREISPGLLMKYCGMDSLLEYDVAMAQQREMGIV